MQIILLSLLAYLCGSIPFGKILGNFKGIDIQKNGSGNIGFANAVRVLGWRLGILVLIGDVCKGILPVYIAKFYFDASLQEQMIVGLIAVIGHAFPIWLKFKGGKSIATGFGVLLVIEYKLAIMAAAVYCIVFGITKKSAMGSVLAAWSLPFTAALLFKNIFVYSLVLAAFATYTHRKNIRDHFHERTS